MKKGYSIFLGLMLCLSSGVQAQHINRNKFIPDSLDNYINRALTNWRIPGVAVGIVKDGKIVLMKGYGIKELGVPSKVDQNTLFMIGSNTKAFTATMLATLEQQKKLSLNDPVTKYLPNFKLENNQVTHLVTLRDLLCHRLGFGTFQGDFTYWTSNLNRAEVIEKMSHVKALYPFRTTWGYTNAAFLTAGEVIPKVTGKSWEEYLKETIFAPLGMGYSIALSADLTKQINKAAAHTLSDGRLIAIPLPQIDNLAPAGSISSCASDMNKWMMALLDNGKVGARQVIPAAAIATTRQAQDIVGSSTRLNGDTYYELYGLGWVLQDYAGKRLVMHDGGVNGFVSSVTLLPSENLGIVILTNSDQNYLYEALRWEILDAFLKRPYYNYSDKYLAMFKSRYNEDLQNAAKMRDSVAMNLKPELSLNKYTGEYVNDLYGKLTVTKGDNNDLEIRFEHHPRMFARAQPLGGNRFYITFSDPVFGKAIFPFTVQNGKVISLRVKVADEVEYTPYDFRKL
ncbi:serine hydrolase [Mucilaginibacter sp. RS28]|uniref:Serine hydrolase n=1 Tax=Mucilaginibacter straminoryzae TaxID=2932774 RepID=A0A9X1WZI1_9SPHI|nr:serine hydrolase [Mucilaginibacter straminoryzae]MCJ8208298.1 serine hydrolase [Mucilaginibacter straminoryzae]